MRIAELQEGGYMRKKYLFLIPLFAIITFVVLALSPLPSQYTTQDVWPGLQWRTSPPEEQGIDSQGMVSLLQEIRQKESNIHSLLIIRHGTLVTEIYFPPYDRNVRHSMRSITKSVTSAMTGIAIGDGYIDRVSQKVLSFFPEIASHNRDKWLENLTIEHLLTMSAGYQRQSMPSLEGKDTTFDVVDYILTYSSIIIKPGTSFFYDSGLSHVVSAVIQKQSGLTLQDYAREKMFQPVGIKDFIWEKDPGGITLGQSGLALKPQDMARFGYLYLHNGQWNGKQIIPKEWIRASTTKHMETRGLMNAAEDDGYGYYWWINPMGGFSAHGHGGQYIFVLPDQDMVVVFTAGLPDSQFPLPLELLKKYILPSIRSDKALKPNPQAWQKLQKEIEEIQNPRDSQTRLPEITSHISEKIYQLSGGEKFGFFDEISFDFYNENNYSIQVHFPDGRSYLFIGRSGKAFYPNIIQGNNNEKKISAVNGDWQDEKTFVVKIIDDLETNVDMLTLESTFDGDKINIQVRSGMEYTSFVMSGDIKE